MSGFKKGHQKDICFNEIEIRAQYMLTILGSRINIIRGTYIII